MERNLRGMLLLDKPVGLTSFQAIGACKRLFGTKKIGHAGTLDKFASGLLLVFVGEATRLVPWFVGLDKQYQACLRFGAETATLDPEGAVIRTGPVPDPETVLRKLPSFTGAQQQIPPEYSAIHVNGKRAYERVLAGEILDLKPRTVMIHSLEAGPWNGNDLALKVHCSTGTYIRSLARDLGEATGSAAHLIALRRNLIGEFKIDDAITLPDRPEPFSIELSSQAWLTDRRLAFAIPGIGIRELVKERVSDFRNGKLIREDWFDTVLRDNPGSSTIQHRAGNPGQGTDWAIIENQHFLGIVNQGEGAWSYRLVFPVGTDITDS